MHFGIMSI